MFDVKLEIVYHVPHMCARKVGAVVSQKMQPEGAVLCFQEQNCTSCVFKDTLLIHNPHIAREIQMAGFHATEVASVSYISPCDADYVASAARLSGEVLEMLSKLAKDGKYEYELVRSCMQIESGSNSMREFFDYAHTQCVSDAASAQHKEHKYVLDPVYFCSLEAVHNNVRTKAKIFSPYNFSGIKTLPKYQDNLKRFKHFTAYMLNYSYKTETLCCFTRAHTDYRVAEHEQLSWEQCLTNPYDKVTEKQVRNLPYYKEDNMLFNLYKVCRRVCNLNFQYDSIYGPTIVCIRTLSCDYLIPPRPSIELACAKPQVSKDALYNTNGSLSAMIARAKDSTLAAERVNKIFNYAIYLPDDIGIAVYMRFCDKTNIVQTFQKRLQTLKDATVFCGLNSMCSILEDGIILQNRGMRRVRYKFECRKIRITYTNGLFNAIFADRRSYSEESQKLLQELVDIHRSVHWMGINGFCHEAPVVFHRIMVRLTNEYEFNLQHISDENDGIMVKRVIDALSILLGRGISYVNSLSEELNAVYYDTVVAVTQSKVFMARESLRLAVSMTHNSVHYYVKSMLDLPQITDILRQCAKAAILHVEDLSCTTCAELYTAVCVDTDGSVTIGAGDTECLSALREEALRTLSLLRTIDNNNDTLTRAVVLKAGCVPHVGEKDFDILYELYLVYKARNLGGKKPFLYHKIGTKDMETLYSAANKEIPIHLFKAPNMSFFRGADMLLWPDGTFARNYSNTNFEWFEIAVERINNVWHDRAQAEYNLLNTHVDTLLMQSQRAMLLHESRPHNINDISLLDADLSFLEVINVNNCDILSMIKMCCVPSVCIFNFFMHDGNSKRDNKAVLNIVYNVFIKSQNILPHDAMKTLLQKVDHTLQNKHYINKLYCIAYYYKKYIKLYSILRYMHRNGYANMPEMVYMPMLLHTIRSKLDDDAVVGVLYKYVDFMTTYTILCKLHKDMSQAKDVLHNLGNMFVAVCEHLSQQLDDDLDYDMVSTYLLMQDLMCILYSLLVKKGVGNERISIYYCGEYDTMISDILARGVLI